LFRRIKIMVTDNPGLYEFRLNLLLKQKVYVSTEDYYETYKNGIVRDKFKKEGKDAMCSICL